MMKSPPQGLSSEEAVRRLAEFDPNAVAEPHDRLLARIARRFWEPVPWMLEAAIILQLAIAFVSLVFASQATIYVLRERKRMWQSRPGIWLVLSSLLDIGIATILSIAGILMTPLPAWVVAAIFLGAAVFSLVLDEVKLAAFSFLAIRV